jgi:DNA-binding FadR family transcriptional regulator
MVRIGLPGRYQSIRGFPYSKGEELPQALAATVQWFFWYTSACRPCMRTEIGNDMRHAGTGAALDQAINDNFLSGRWRAGHRLPTERALSEEFGVSRTTVRRVLAGFKQRRLISQVVGSGTYVARDLTEVLPGSHLPSLPAATSPAELMDARQVLEPAIVQMVVSACTSQDLRRMEVCCERAEAATSLEEFERWDGLLHEAIAEAAHNTLVLKVFRLLNDARSEEEWGLLKKRSVTPERRLSYQKEHRSIVQALRERDPEAARAATQQHLAHVRRNLLGY